MVTKKTTTRTICASRTILRLKKTPSKTSAISEKSVRILDPNKDVEKLQFQRDRKKIKEKKLRVQEFMIELYHVRKIEFTKLKKNYESKRFYNQIKRCVMWVLLFWLLFSMIKGSICHYYNPACQLFWYEAFFGGIFSCFVSTRRDFVPM